MKIVFGTGNEHKLKEVRAIMPESIQLLSLRDILFTLTLPETHDTIEDNAVEKVTFLYDHIDIPCFAEDTGLVVPAIGGEPGVYSARYAGEPCNDVNNYTKLLHRLNEVQDRYAYFKTVIAYKDEEAQLSIFEGILEGEIAFAARGKNGFGYDPIFLIDHERSLAEYSLEEKKVFSHRTKALKKFLLYVNEKMMFKISDYPHNLLKNHAT